MMSPAEWDRELVADSSAERSLLRKAQMMGIARLASADQTGLLGDKAKCSRTRRGSRCVSTDLPMEAEGPVNFALFLCPSAVSLLRLSFFGSMVRKQFLLFG